METLDFSVIEYKAPQAAELLRLILALQDSYFHINASRQIQETKREKDIKKSYEEYVTMINENTDDSWKVYLATVQENKIIGFIIGSIEKDEYLVKSNIGKVEDWYTEDGYRGKGVGKKLYAELERWFKERGCQQVISDTWQDNEPSISAHKKLGFFISGVSFGKILK